MTRFFVLPLVIVVLVALHGCDGGDRRLAEMANEASRRQAEQNREMARLNRDVAAHNRRLIESGDNLTSLQRELQTERRDLADQYRFESLLAPIVATLGGIVVCLLPLAVCLYLFHTLGNESTDDGVVELLLDETLAVPPASMARPSRFQGGRPALARDAVESASHESQKQAAPSDDPSDPDHTDDLNDTGSHPF